MQHSKLLRRGVALGGSLLAALALTLGTAPATSANPVDGTLELPTNTTCEGGTGSITINARQLPSGTNGNGLPDASVTNPPILGGVEFTLRRATDINLTTNLGWQQAADLNAATDSVATFLARTDLVTATPTPLTTNADGVVTFNNLPMGLYLVTGVALADGASNPEPFFVTIPMRHPSPAADATPAERWLCDVTVYPKMSQLNFTKSVIDSGALNVGDPVLWTISTEIPVTASGNTTSFTITDPIDSRLNLDIDDVVVMIDGTPVAEGVAPYNMTVDIVGGVLTIGFGNPNALPQGDTLVVTYETAVQSVGTGVIRNTATLTANGQTATASAETRWGAVLLTKTSRGTDAPLPGAVFRVFPTEAAALANDDTDVITTTAPTAADGTIRIEGFRAPNWQNGSANPTGTRQVWLVESVAPAGHELLTEPVPVTLNPVGSDATLATNNVTPITVQNIPVNAGFELPMTGGVGTTILTYGGAGILGLALVYLVVTRRKSDVESDA